MPVYTDPLISRSPGCKAPPPKPRGAALALVAASTGATAVAASASSAGARQRLLTCQGRWVIAGRTSSAAGPLRRRRSPTLLTQQGHSTTVE